MEGEEKGPYTTFSASYAASRGEAHRRDAAARQCRGSGLSKHAAWRAAASREPISEQRRAAASSGEQRRAAAISGEQRRTAASSGEQRRAAASSDEHRRASESSDEQRRAAARQRTRAPLLPVSGAFRTAAAMVGFRSQPSRASPCVVCVAGRRYSCGTLLVRHSCGTYSWEQRWGKNQCADVVAVMRACNVDELHVKKSKPCQLTKSWVLAARMAIFQKTIAIRCHSGHRRRKRFDKKLAVCYGFL